MNDIFNLIIIKFQYCHYVARRFFKMFDLKDCWMTRKERVLYLGDLNSGR